MASLKRRSLLMAELAKLFLRLGLTAFGGPAAHIALMRREVVDRLGWLSESEFLDLLGLANLIPGPSSTELAIFIGRRRAGGAGLVLAGACFILPAALLVLALAWGYTHYGRLPQVQGVLRGVGPVVVAAVAQAVWALGRTAWKTRTRTLTGLAALALAAVGVSPLTVLFGAGAALGLRHWAALGRAGGARSLAPLGVIAAVCVAAPMALAHILPSELRPGPLPLFFVFLKAGATVLGSGYVLLSFLQGDLVARLHWLTPGQLLDAVAVGQVTPGPVFTTATFIGFLLAGPAGALAATVGVFLPGFAFVALLGPQTPRLRRAPLTGAFLDGVNAAAVALMALVTWQIARAALVGPATVLLALASAFLLLRFRVNPAWLVLGGALLGLLFPLR